MGQKHGKQARDHDRDHSDDLAPLSPALSRLERERPTHRRAKSANLAADAPPLDWSTFENRSNARRKSSGFLSPGASPRASPRSSGPSTPLPPPPRRPFDSSVRSASAPASGRSASPRRGDRRRPRPKSTLVPLDNAPLPPGAEPAATVIVTPAPAPPPRVTLDRYAHPQIFERILAYVSPEAYPALRATCRALHVRINTVLYKHVELHVDEVFAMSAKSPSLTTLALEITAPTELDDEGYPLPARRLPGLRWGLDSPWDHGLCVDRLRTYTRVVDEVGPGKIVLLPQEEQRELYGALGAVDLVRDRVQLSPLGGRTHVFFRQLPAGLNETAPRVLVREVEPVVETAVITIQINSRVHPSTLAKAAIRVPGAASHRPNDREVVVIFLPDDQVDSAAFARLSIDDKRRSFAADSRNGSYSRLNDEKRGSGSFARSRNGSYDQLDARRNSSYNQLDAHRNSSFGLSSRNSSYAQLDRDRAPAVASRSATERAKPLGMLTDLVDDMVRHSPWVRYTLVGLETLRKSWISPELEVTPWMDAQQRNEVIYKAMYDFKVGPFSLTGETDKAVEALQALQLLSLDEYKAMVGDDMYALATTCPAGPLVPGFVNGDESDGGRSDSSREHDAGDDDGTYFA
ncbi:uncharacterized protein LOC62_07G008910 [Vanrija pseudolonga]|uniref:Uncharacterized protein n=1 Tax=Vanrija pseudolonga TaxID=143232 RepID=A0AAF0YJ10_9TREE|nr:hypothetical protein LOC62_07G008910 [Vanrija pseudolonga]